MSPTDWKERWKMEKVSCPLCRGKGDINPQGHSFKSWMSTAVTHFVHHNPQLDDSRKQAISNIMDSNIEAMMRLINMNQRREVRDSGDDKR